MCGRIFQTHAIQALLRISKTNQVKNLYNFNPTYNMGPTNYIPAIRQVDIEEGGWNDYSEQQNQEIQQVESQEIIQNEPKQLQSKRGLDFLKWGYQTKFSLIINARVEELQDKTTFKPLLNTRRCVVIAEGYYEWNTKKEPFVYRKKDKSDLMMAAMYTDDGEVFVLTRESFGEFTQVHHRMPVLLEDDEIDMWINTKQNNFYEIIDRKILNQQKQIWNSVTAQKVAPYVNNIKEKGDKCLMTLQEYKEQLYQKGLGRYFQKKSTKKEENYQEEKEILTTSQNQQLSQKQAINIDQEATKN